MYPSIGSVVALFQVDSLALDVSQGLNVILANPDAIPDLNVFSVNINGRHYPQSAIVTPTATNISPTSTKTIGLIVGLVVGLVVGLLIVIGIILLYRTREIAGTHRHAPDDLSGDIPLTKMNEDDISPEASPHTHIQYKANFVPPPIWPRVSIPQHKYSE